MSVYVIDKIKQKNNNTFKIIDSSDINWDAKVPDESVSGTYVKQDEMNSAIAQAVAGAPHLKRVVLAKGSTLPATGDENTIYMLPDLTESQNEYTEYFYLNGKFEKLGGAKTDLTNYLTKDEVAKSISTAQGSASADAQSKADAALAGAKAYTDQEKTKYLPLSGGIISGKTIYDVSLTDEKEVVNKAYVDSAIAAYNPTDKLTKEDITIGTTNGTIKVRDQEVKVAGLKTAAFHEDSDFLTPSDLTWNSIE